MEKDLKLVEGDIVPIYENKQGERLIDARELHGALQIGRDFTTWIKGRISKYLFIEKEDYILTFTKIGERKNIIKHEYFLTLDMAKELCMIENNEIGRKIRKYFIEIEKRYRTIIESPQTIFDIMHLALNQIEENEKKLKIVQKESKQNTQEIEEIKKKIDVIIQKDYCLASDIAEQLHIYSENDLPHSNFIGAIARTLGMKISYKHYYEDERIAIVPDISKGNQYYQVYYKPKAVEEIIKWFKQNKEEIEYKIIYERNTKHGEKGKIKEQGFKIENICYKIKERK